MLQSIPLFCSLSGADLTAISLRIVKRFFAKNSILVHEGDSSDSLFIIESGKVKVYVGDEDGREITLSVHGPGEYFGEIALLDESPRSASVMTLEDSKLYMISKADFDDCIAKNPEIAAHLVKGLAGRIRALTQNVKSLALMDVYGRVARTLLSLAQEKDGRLIISNKLTQREIANMVGASREMISRIFKDLTQGGYITIDRDGITINEKLPPQW